MANDLGKVGAAPSKQVRFAPLYTSRFYSGIWTNRSPLRDANTTRLVEQFYGKAGDAMIAGLNVEVTNKLTLSRRPGLSVYDNNSWNAVDRFYEFRIFDTTSEEIILMVDQANALYSLEGGVQTEILAKSTGAGQTFMQSVGNTLYFGDGVETGKWLQTLTTWSANTNYGTNSNPFFSTWFLDVNKHIMQLVGTSFPIVSTSFTAPTSSTNPTVTIGSSVNLTNILTAGDVLTFPSGMVASYLDTQSATIISFPSTSSMIVTYPLNWLQNSFTTTTESTNGIAFNTGTPKSGSTQPVGTGPSQSSDFFQSGLPAFYNADIPPYIIDGSAVWADRGLQTENWGIDNTKATTPITTFSPNGVAQTGTNGSWLFYSTFVGGTGVGGNFYVVDSNNNLQFSSAGGISGATPPVWNTILGETTIDGTITWTLVYESVLSPQNGGYQYCVGLVNTLDNTVSNVSKLSVATGNFIGGQGIRITGGLPPSVRLPLALFPSVNIDPQTDYVAIFRTTDGEATPFLIPGESTTYTLPLADYIANGYIDNTQDVGLNNLISAPINLENTIPQSGAINLTYHLGRVWYSIGNVVYWTSGADSPVGNGIDGYSPLNFDSFPSLVTRLVPIAAGLIVFTLSDIYVIQGSGTAASPILPGVPLVPGLGLLNYNALDTNGALIGFFSTDKQFIILDPSSGVTSAGYPINDQLRLNTGTPGTSWNPATAYVAWHVDGQDQAWYLGDAVNGWFRLMSTPAPETGYTWSPYALITNGVKALQSIETTPGVHKLLLGPVNTGSILQRDLSIYSDNGTAYNAYAVFGSIVLTQPGQVAIVDHIVTDAVKIGSPVSIGVLVDEALPYYTGPIDILKDWVSDPPTLPASNSLYSQRFYLAALQNDAAVMRHCQVAVYFNQSDTVANELLTFTIFGSYNQEI